MEAVEKVEDERQPDERHERGEPGSQIHVRGPLTRSRARRLR